MIRKKDRAVGRVKCDGKWHHVEVDGKAVRLLDHSEDELQAERVAMLMGEGHVDFCPCLQMLDAVLQRMRGRRPRLRLPKALEDLFIRRDARRHRESRKAYERLEILRGELSRPGLRRP